jgi:hypothetical protein
MANLEIQHLLIPLKPEHQWHPRGKPLVTSPIGDGQNSRSEDFETQPIETKVFPRSIDLE